MRKIIVLILLVWNGLQGQTQQIWQIEGDSVFTYYMLEEVVLYGERLSRGPSMITEISAKEIQQNSGITVVDVLKIDPGVVINTGSKAETETRIRGFDARDVLVLVDGRPINPGYYGKADLSMLPKDNIAKIKVINGPSSVAYGTNAMGGVINIVTKNGFESPRTRVDMEFGDNTFRKISLNHSGSRGRFNYWVSGYEHHADGYEMSREFEVTSLEDGGLRENSMYHKVGGNLKLGYQPSDKAVYQLSAGYHWAKKECPWTIYTWDGPQYRDFPKWERYAFSMSGQWQLLPLLELKSVAFTDVYNDRFVDYQNREMDDDQINYDSILENWTTGINTDLMIRSFHNHQLHVGAHFRRDLMNKKPDTDEAWFSHYNMTATFFGEDYFRLFKTTALTLGASFNLFRSESRDEFTRHLSPMVSLNQKLPFKLNATASFANAIRFPTMHQLYSQSSGNENLKPEEVDKYEIGLERLIAVQSQKDWHAILEFSYFINDLKNLIYRESLSYQYRNIEDAKMQGWEMRVTMNMRPWFSAVLSFSHLNDRQSSSELMEEVPKNQAGVRLTGSTSFGTELTYEYNLSDERSTYVNTFYLKKFQVHHLHLSQKIWKQLRLHLRIRNMFNADYQEELGYPAPGRQMTAGFSWD